MAPKGKWVNLYPDADGWLVLPRDVQCKPLLPGNIRQTHMKAINMQIYLRDVNGGLWKLNAGRDSWSEVAPGNA